MKNLKLRRPLALVCLLFLCGVFLLLQLAPYEEEPLPWADGEEALLRGRLARREIRIDAEGNSGWVWYVETQERKLRVQCYMDGDTDAEAAPIGALVAIRGKIRRFQTATNPGEFDTAAYYRVTGIACRLTGAQLVASDGRRNVLREGLCELRLVLGASLDACLSAEDAGILRAMLLGDRSAMDKETKNLYRQSGILHILAVSGLHISLIGMGLFTLLCRLRCPHAAAAFVCVPAMIAYGEMCGQTPSAVRAILMFALRLAALAMGRSYDLLTALALAAALLVIEQPLYLTYSGFLLSFLSVLAIGAFFPALTPKRIRDYVPARGDPPWKKPLFRLLSALFASLSVSLITLPVDMLFFYTVPVYAVLLNVLILPLMPAVIGAGLLCMTAGTVSPVAGAAVGLADHVLLELYEKLCLMESALPGAVWVTGHAGAWQVAVYYAMLAAMVLVTCRVREKGRRGLLLRALWLAAAIAVLSFRRSPDLRIAVLDVGQGDGIVIEGEGRCFLIDGGSTSRTEIGSYVLSPYLAYAGIDRLDAAILTHEDEDHMNGLLALLEDETDALAIGRLVLPAIAPESRGENYRRLEAAAARHGISVSYLSRGEEVLRGALSIRCLGPAAGMRTEEPNETSTILYLTYGSFSALFTGDVEGAGETALLTALAGDPEIARNLTLLKVAHHGSRYTTDQALLTRTHPRIAVISCGRNNRYGHPHEELLRRLEDAGAETFVTAGQGAVIVETDGKRVRVSGFLN